MPMTAMVKDIGMVVLVQVTMNMEALSADLVPREQLTMDGLEMLVLAQLGQLLKIYFSLHAKSCNYDYN